MAETPRYGQIDNDYGMQLATTSPEDDGPIWMVNLMKYRDIANYADGRQATISGRKADDIYAPVDVLADIGAEIVFVADVDQQLLDTTIVAGCLPNPNPESEPVDWAEVPHPPTADDGPVVVIHVLRFDEASAAGTTPEEMVAYQNEAGKVAVPHGARINEWFGVEGTIIGDGRAWHQVRFNEFPSKAAFMAVVTDPARLRAQEGHREVAIADTYTMILRPTINQFAEPA